MQCCWLLFLKPLLIFALFFREVHDVKINSLPTSNTRDDLSLCCDTCARKGVANQQAVVYCKTCTAKFCAKHRKVRISKSHSTVHFNFYLKIDTFCLLCYITTVCSQLYSIADTGQCNLNYILQC